MDYNNMDSEVIESLNLLRPPVKRKPCCDAHRDYIVKHNTPNKFTTVTDKRSLGHSTSLILRNTSGGQIFKQYPSVCYTSLYNQTQSASQRTIPNDKQLIKVTVIPKQRHLRSKVLGKPKDVTKTVQSTSSIQENNTKTNNLYLVVAGRKRNKIYEIKTTSSAILDTKPIKDGAIAFGTINNLVNNITMEKKRKKDKKGSRDEQNEAKSISESMQYKEHVCTCEPGHIHESNNQKSGKSTVKVYGRVGLTQNDKYIVKCQATVNDKPVPIISAVEKQSSSSYIPVYQDNTTSTYQFACMRRGTQHTDSNYHRDFKLQTDFQNNAVQQTQMGGDDPCELSKETQSTQVNFNYKTSHNNRVDCDNSYYTKQRISKCHCTRPLANNVMNSPTEKSIEFERNNDVKSHQSPLVVISVFPKQDDNLGDIIKTYASSCVEQIQIRREHEQVQIKQEQEREDQKKSKVTDQNKNEIQTKYENINEYHENEPKPVKKSRGRSPQPKVRKQKNVIESRHVKTSLKRDNSQRSNQKATKETSQLKKNESNKTKKTSPTRSPRPKSPTATSKPQKNSISRQNSRPKSPKKVDKSVNTEHLLEKKAIIECYTKKLDEQMSPITYKGKPPVNSFSKVSVNIDSENDYYDVTFHQDNRTTDVNVRKTMKDAGAQNDLDDPQKHGSLENYYPYMSRKHGRNYYQSVNYNQSNDDISIIVNDTPRLTPRDSLEVSHRRGDKNLIIPQAHRPSTNAKLTEKSNVMEFIAPDKHYPGDDCDIGDPIERDREIRILLGVEKRRHKSIIRCVDELQCQDNEIGNLGLRRCFSKQRDTPIINSPSYKILNSTNDNQIIHNITKSKPAVYSEAYEHIEPRKRVKPICPQTKQNNIYKNIIECHEQSKSKMEMKPCIQQTSLFDNLIKSKSIDSEVKVNGQNLNELSQYDDIKKNHIHQQFNLNRDIQVFLQLEVKPFSNKKPIVLSRMQYSKVRRTIQRTVVSGKNNKKCIKKRSMVSIGLVRGMPKKNVVTYFSKEVQTEPINVQIKPALDAEKSIKLTLKETNEKETIILFSRNVPKSVKVIPRNDSSRPAVSSVQIKYASMKYWNDITFSATNEGSIRSSTYTHRSQPTIETLFKHHRRSPTPNLGTSALSLLSTEAVRSESRVKLSSPDVKAKRPFLKRLMSCLVMRSSATAKPDPPSTQTILDSSVDSYHISTAFGAIEMTSSIYDTTGSFYSNHSIHPLSSKLKRGGFFSSVIGLLTNRKS